MAKGGFRVGAGRKPTKMKAVVNGDTLHVPMPAATLLAAATQTNPPAPTPPPTRYEPPPLPMPAKIKLTGPTPLQFLLKTMKDRDVEMALRIRAAVAAAEYIHAKMPQAIHVKSEVRLEAVVVHVVGGPAVMPWGTVEQLRQRAEVLDTNPK